MSRGEVSGSASLHLESLEERKYLLYIIDADNCHFTILLFGNSEGRLYFEFFHLEFFFSFIVTILF